MGLQTETLILPYVINQTLIQGWIWAFQLKSYLMVQEPAASDEVLLQWTASAIDLDRYTGLRSIWAALETGHVALARASWLIKHAQAGTAQAVVL